MTHCPDCGAFLLADGEGFRCAGCLYRSPSPAGWYRIELRGRGGHIVTAVETDAQGTVVTAAPILRWARGRPIEHVATWVQHRHGAIERMPWEP